MSCAVFTFLGLYVAVSGRTNKWLLGASSVAAIAFFIIAAYGAWLDEHRRNIELQRDIETLTDEKARKARLLELKIKISQYATAGADLRNQAPPSPNEVPLWKQNVNHWATDVRNFLNATCSPLASQKFLDTNELTDCTFPGKHSSTWPVLNPLGKMITNLREIIENPDTYLGLN